MTDTHRYEGLTPLQRIRAEDLDAKVEKKAWAFMKKNHETFPCECDSRSKHRCTKSGWVRCNKRLAAIGAKKAEIRAEMIS